MEILIIFGFRVRERERQRMQLERGEEEIKCCVMRCLLSFRADTVRKVIRN